MIELDTNILIRYLTRDDLDQWERADFSDYLIGAIARQIGCSETVTFDQKLRTEQGFHCL